MASSNWCRSACIAAGIVALLTAAALAEQPSDDDVKNVMSQLIAASIDIGMQQDADGARKACTDAETITKKFDPDPYWTAQTESCFATVDDFQNNVASACQHYRVAAESYDKVRSNPQASYRRAGSTETELKRIGEAYARLKCPGTIPAASTAKMARPPGLAEINDIMGLTLGVMSSTDLYNDPEGAKKSCDDAQAYADRFEPDSYVAAMVDDCYGYYEAARKNQAAACSRYAKAAQEYAALPATHKAFKNVAYGLETVREAQAKLGC
jgi:hypothetical protein